MHHNKRAELFWSFWALFLGCVYFWLAVAQNTKPFCTAAQFMRESNHFFSWWNINLCIVHSRVVVSFEPYPEILAQELFL